MCGLWSQSCERFVPSLPPSNPLSHPHQIPTSPSSHNHPHRTTTLIALTQTSSPSPIPLPNSTSNPHPHHFHPSPPFHTQTPLTHPQHSPTSPSQPICFPTPPHHTTSCRLWMVGRGGVRYCSIGGVSIMCLLCRHYRYYLCLYSASLYWRRLCIPDPTMILYASPVYTIYFLYTGTLDDRCPGLVPWQHGALGF